MIDKELSIHDDICTGCSACTEACAFPDENDINPIQLVQNNLGLYVPRINTDTCTSCMACYNSCPTEDKIFNNEVTFENYKNEIGKCYYGYSLDKEHRFEAATAGITTEIASYLLETYQVDGVVSSYQNDSNEIITDIFKDSEGLKRTKGSIYRQVPLLNGLAKKIEEGKYEKILVIGLPCHIAGLKTLKKTNKHLRKNVDFITIALFCKQTKTDEFSDYTRSILKSKKNKKITFRGKGWPGFTRVEDKHSLSSTNLRLSINWPTFTFTPLYCFTCSDPLGIDADISVGDAWLDKYNTDNIGSSFFIANTKKGLEIINEMIDKKIIVADEEIKENIINSQNYNYIKLKTSYPLIRNSMFGAGKMNKNTIDTKQYQKLLKWIKLNKNLYQFLARKKIMKYLPLIFLRILLKIYNLGFNTFAREGK